MVDFTNWNDFFFSTFRLLDLYVGGIKIRLTRYTELFRLLDFYVLLRFCCVCVCGVVGGGGGVRGLGVRVIHGSHFYDEKSA